MKSILLLFLLCVTKKSVASDAIWQSSPSNDELHAKLAQLEKKIVQLSNELGDAQTRIDVLEKETDQLKSSKNLSESPAVKILGSRASPVPSSCAIMQLNGYTQSGYFLFSTVNGVVSDVIKTVYCNFDVPAGIDGYETIIANTTADTRELQSQLEALQSQVNDLAKASDGGQMPTNCNDIKLLGWVKSGFYMVKGSSSQVSTVYCDFSKMPGSQGYQQTVGNNDIKTSDGVYFYARDGSADRNYDIITYRNAVTNNGNAMNPGSGEFTAPVSGTYFFTLQVNKEHSGYSTGVSIEKNGEGVAYAYCSEGSVTAEHCSLFATLNLNKGDNVRGSKDGRNVGLESAEFSGFLIGEILSSLP